MSPPPKISRRGFTLGAAAMAGVALIAGAVYEVPKLFKRRARGQHADLVNRLTDPEQAAIIGRAVHLDASEDSIANELKKRFAKNTLAATSAPRIPQIWSCTAWWKPKAGCCRSPSRSFVRWPRKRFSPLQRSVTHAPPRLGNWMRRGALLHQHLQLLFRDIPKRLRHLDTDD